MMRSGAVSLADYPGDSVELACDKCGRRGRYHKVRLVAEHGPQTGLPDLRMRLAGDCPRALRPIGNDLCGVRYANLVRA